MLNFKDYKDKMMGCWMGKNIGGTLGAPFEGTRKVYDVEFYQQDLKGNPPANDDLDLQLVWLNAVEKFGRATNASILGEYWLTHIIPDWVEYGAGKNNLRKGIVPPMAGYMSNLYKDSCGCFIRSEIWACLAPGHPEIAVKYAYEDAIVDHSDEGLYGEIFCAAVQSAAFVIKDKYELINIGLSYIPEDCAVAKGIKIAIESYKSGADFKAARKNVMIAVPGTFGVQGASNPLTYDENGNPINELDQDVPIGRAGFDAPSNIGITVIGWLYGEGDFGKSICIAVNCGEDTDCTGATLGAILGIIYGYSNIPTEWIEPMGDVINTICINNLGWTLSIPKTVTELTDRFLRLTPSFLGAQLCDILAGPEGYTIKTLGGSELYCVNDDLFIKDINGCGKSSEPLFKEVLKRAPYAVTYKFPAFDVVMDYINEPYMKLNESRKLKLNLLYNGNFYIPQWINIKWHLPEGVSISPLKECTVNLPHSYHGKVELEYEIKVENINGSKIELVADISSEGRHSRGFVPVTLFLGI